MPLAPAPIQTVIEVPAQGDRDASSIYVGGLGPNRPGNNSGEFAFSQVPAWASWFAQLVAWVNQNSAIVTSVTCDAITDTVSNWICALWADDQALQIAVLGIDDRLNAITCGLDTFDIETWICAHESDITDLGLEIIAIEDFLDNITVDVCGTPFTQTLTATLQDIVDNIFFDLGGGCASVIDYITDLYTLFGGPYMPIDANGSGVVPPGQGIYADLLGFIAGMQLDSAGVGFADNLGIIGGFVAFGATSPGFASLATGYNDGAGQFAQVELLPSAAIPAGYYVLGVPA